MKPVKVLYIVSDIDKALAFEWIADRIDRNKIDLKFILLGRFDTFLAKFLKERNVLLSVIHFRGKKDSLAAWIQLFKLISHHKPKVIHTHLYHATLLGLSAAWMLRVPKRIHTRHHASIHHDQFPWAVRVDKVINALSTHIVTLSTPQREILLKWENASAKKLRLIPHGFDATYFNEKHSDKISQMRDRYKIPENSFVIGVVARYTEWKGIQYIIRAVQTVIHERPDIHLVLTNAQGDYVNRISESLNELPKESFTEISFEPDMASLYQLFDIYVHTPVDKYCEAFGQTYVEALLAGIPSIFTLSGIANDFIRHQESAIIVEYRNHEAIARAIKLLMDDAELRARLSANGRLAVREFALENMLQNLEKLYIE